MDWTALAAQLAQASPEAGAALFNLIPKGLDDALGMRFVAISAERVEVELEVTAAHLQPYGLVHGGVYCALTEASCSVGAALTVLATGHNAVGIENHTRFRAAARIGAVLRCVAQPRAVDGPDHRWHATIHAGETLCAEGTVVVRALPADKAVAGATLTLPESR